MSWLPGQLGGVLKASGDPPVGTLSSLMILARNVEFSAWEPVRLRGGGERRTRSTQIFLHQPPHLTQCLDAVL